MQRELSTFLKGPEEKEERVSMCQERKICLVYLSVFKTGGANDYMISK
jgi:hypothetical protein